MPQSQIPIVDFLNALAAKQPTPGGGSASALGGALGAALGSMAAQYTIGNPKYAAFETAAASALADLEQLRASLLNLIDADIAAYDSYRAASALPKSSDAEKSARRAAMAEALERSTTVPSAILNAAKTALECIDTLSRNVNPNLAGDVASSAYFLEACARGAAIQILSNCAADDPSGKNAAARQTASDSVAHCQDLREKIHATVLAILKLSA